MAPAQHPLTISALAPGSMARRHNRSREIAAAAKQRVADEQHLDIGAVDVSSSGEERESSRQAHLKGPYVGANVSRWPSKMDEGERI